MADSEFAIIRQQPSSASVPLILVHDGGGTIFPYFAIHDIGRDIYGIALSGRGEPWEDGIADIADKYTALVKAQSLPASAVILGGWSLGGIIALEMARLLYEDPELEVKGVVMMESIYPPLVSAQQQGAIDPTDVTLGNGISLAARSRILKSLNKGHEAVKAHRIQPGSELTATVLITADDPWPSLRGGKFEMPAKLGWDDDGLGVVKHVYSTSGHHYSIFDEENAASITANLSEACAMLENGVWG